MKIRNLKTAGLKIREIGKTIPAPRRVGRPIVDLRTQLAPALRRTRIRRKAKPQTRA